MAGNRIGSNEHPPGVREKNNITYRNPPRGCGFFYSTPFVLTYDIPLKLGKYFFFVCTHRTVGAFCLSKNGALCSASGVSGRSVAAASPLRNLVHTQISENGVNRHVL